MKPEPQKRALQLCQANQEMARLDPVGYRREVIIKLVEQFGISVSTAAVYFNQARKALNPAAAPIKGKVPVTKLPKIDENDCYSVIEVLDQGKHGVVGRTRSFMLQGDASEHYDSMLTRSPESRWVLIYGLGPIHGEHFKLSQGERVIYSNR